MSIHRFRCSDGDGDVVDDEATGRVGTGWHVKRAGGFPSCSIKSNNQLSEVCGNFINTFELYPGCLEALVREKFK